MDFTGKIALAPMAGICDLPFRLLCKEMGCDIVYTEMVSAKGMYYNNKNTGPLLMTKPEEAPIGVQKHRLAHGANPPGEKLARRGKVLRAGICMEVEV